jgi:capsular exopolysaccharide synthesis family protein
MELRDYLNVMRARMRLIIVSVVAVTVVVVGVSLLQKPAYEGVALVTVAQQDTGSTILGTPQVQSSYMPGRDVVQTQVEIIQSPRIASQVIANLGLHDTPAGLLTRVTVSADTGTTNISIQAIDPSAARAAEIANGFAEAYVTWSRDSQSASIKTAADDVERRLALAQKQIVSIEQTASASDVDQTRLQSARALYTTLSDKLEELRIAQQLVTGNGSVLSSASIEPAPVSPKPVRDTALGLAIGLLVGLSVAFVAEQLDTRIATADEASKIYGAPVLASIPTEKVSTAELARLTLTERPDSPTAEAYRMLRNNLAFINFDKSIRTILVTSAVPSEGKSTVAANLATVLSQAGSHVVLVVCDFYLPAAERFFDIDYRVGLSSVLAGTVGLSAALQKPAAYENLAVLSAGPLPPNPSELLGSEMMRKLIAALRETSDWVIIDSAPVLATADAAAVTQWVDGVLVVSRVGVSKRETARAGREQLSNVGARILGLAVSGPMEHATALGYYGYHSTR